jgi:hypothetical protein
MTRFEMEHVIRAAAMIADDNELIVIGSQALLAEHAEAPAEVLVSRELDLYPRNYPERADLIDGSIGEGSPFEAVFGYFAHGVGPETALLPQGWEKRLIPVCNENTRKATGWCLEKHDLVLSKLAVGREKHIAFYQALLRAGLVDKDVLRARLAAMDFEPQLLELVRQRVG